MAETHTLQAAARRWCGAPIPPEVPILPHPTALRLVVLLSRFARRFRILWCSLGALFSALFFVVALATDEPVAAPCGVLLLAVVVFVWTRPLRLTVTFRPGARFVTTTFPTGASTRLCARDAVGLQVSPGPAGWTARLELGGTPIATSVPTPDRDSAVARLLPLANALRHEMGGPPVS